MEYVFRFRPLSLTDNCITSDRSVVLLLYVLLMHALVTDNEVYLSKVVPAADSFRPLIGKHSGRLFDIVRIAASSPHCPVLACPSFLRELVEVDGALPHRFVPITESF